MKKYVKVKTRWPYPLLFPCTPHCAIYTAVTMDSQGGNVFFTGCFVHEPWWRAKPHWEMDNAASVFVRNNLEILFEYWQLAPMSYWDPPAGRQPTGRPLYRNPRHFLIFFHRSRTELRMNNSNAVGTSMSPFLKEAFLRLRTKIWKSTLLRIYLIGGSQATQASGRFCRSTSCSYVCVYGSGWRTKSDA